METLWFILWGLLWVIYFLLDGFDLGLGILRPVLAKNDNDLRQIHAATGPFWDGNEVWLITAGGVTFAAFPKVYAVMFSALYAPLLLLLFALIFRAIAMEFREHLSDLRWKKTWDIVLVVSSLLPALLLGVAFANLFMGIPVDADGIYHGNLFMLLNPYGLLGGVVFVALFCQHGALWLASRTEGDLHERSLFVAKGLWMVILTGFVLFLWMTSIYTHLYDNYVAHPQFIAFPIIAVVALILQRPMMMNGSRWGGFICSAIIIASVVAFGLAGMFPGMIISSLNPVWSITAFNGSSSAMTLCIMLTVALCALPFVFIYQAWAYKVFSGNDHVSESY